jgi:hypothetical protein
MSVAQFYAVQIEDREHPREVVWAFIKAALNRQLKPFKKVETFSYLTVGRVRFLRFRTDCPVPDALVEDLLALGRGAIVPAPLNSGICNYIVRTPSGLSGSFNMAAMHAVPAPGMRHVYRGPLVQFWERQFGDLAK